MAEADLFCARFARSDPEEQASLFTEWRTLHPGSADLREVREILAGFPFKVSHLFENLLEPGNKRLLESAFQRRFKGMYSRGLDQSPAGLARLLAVCEQKEGNVFVDLLLDHLSRGNKEQAAVLSDMEEIVRRLKREGGSREAIDREWKTYRELHPELAPVFLIRLQADSELHLEKDNSLLSWTERHLREFEKSPERLTDLTLRLFHKIKHDTSLVQSVEVLEEMCRRPFSTEMLTLLQKIHATTLRVSGKQNEEPAAAEAPEIENEAVLATCLAESQGRLKSIQSLGGEEKVEAIISVWHDPTFCHHSALEGLLEGSEPIFARIMALLSELSRRLTIAELRKYVEGLIEKIQSDPVIVKGNPHLIDRLRHYLNSLEEDPPELLKMVHQQLRRIEEQKLPRPATRSAQIAYLNERLIDPEFHKVRLILYNIIANLSAEEIPVRYYAAMPMETERAALSSLLLLAPQKRKEEIRQALQRNLRLRPAQSPTLPDFEAVEKYFAPRSPWRNFQSIVKATPPATSEDRIAYLSSTLPPREAVQELQRLARSKMEKGELTEGLRARIHATIQRLKRDFTLDQPEVKPELDALLDAALNDSLDQTLPEIESEATFRGSFKELYEQQKPAAVSDTKENQPSAPAGPAWDEKISNSVASFVGRLLPVRKESRQATSMEPEKTVSIGKLALRVEKEFFPLTGKEKARAAFQSFRSYEDMLEKAAQVAEIKSQEEKTRSAASEALVRSIAVVVRIPPDIRVPGSADTICFPRKAWAQELKRKILIKWCRDMARQEAPGSERFLYYTWLGDEIEFKYYLSQYKRGKLD